jgi:hypothetical protein
LTVLAPFETVVLSPLCVSGLGAFVDFRFGVLENETQVPFGMLLSEQNHLLPVFGRLIVMVLGATERPLELQDDVCAPRNEIGQVLGSAGGDFHGQFLALVIERDTLCLKELP